MYPNTRVREQPEKIAGQRIRHLQALSSLYSGPQYIIKFFKSVAILYIYLGCWGLQAVWLPSFSLVFIILSFSVFPLGTTCLWQYTKAGQGPGPGPSSCSTMWCWDCEAGAKRLLKNLKLWIMSPCFYIKQTHKLWDLLCLLPLD